MSHPTVKDLTWNLSVETGGLLVGKTARIELAVQAVARTQAEVDALVAHR